MTIADTSRPVVPSSPARLVSLDALRGFDMFWIIGGSGLVASWAEATGWPVLAALSEQCEHVAWNGFHFWDLIFPLFLFVAGVAMPLSLTRRVAQGHDRRKLAVHVVRRGLLLVALGVLYNSQSPIAHDELRMASVLGRIGLGYLFAGLIVLSTGPRGQLAWVVGILLGYWAALMWIPVPGFGAGDLTAGHTLTDWVDQQLLPGRLHRGDRDPEGLLSTIPAVATALLGALAGHRLVRPTARPGRRNLAFLGAGVACLALGAAWDTVFPINKNLWTSSFVLWTGGWSLMLLAVFHQLVDVWGLRRPAFFFTVIGSNAILIYMLQRFVPFDDLAASALGMFEGGEGLAALAGVGLGLRWLVLWLLYRRRWFLRV